MVVKWRCCCFCCFPLSNTALTPNVNRLQTVIAFTQAFIRNSNFQFNSLHCFPNTLSIALYQPPKMPSIHYPPTSKRSLFTTLSSPPLFAHFSTRPLLAFPLLWPLPSFISIALFFYRLTIFVLIRFARQYPIVIIHVYTFSTLFHSLPVSCLFYTNFFFRSLVWPSMTNAFARWQIFHLSNRDAQHKASHAAIGPTEHKANMVYWLEEKRSALQCWWGIHRWHGMVFVWIFAAWPNCEFRCMLFCSQYLWRSIQWSYREYHSFFFGVSFAVVVDVLFCVDNLLMSFQYIRFCLCCDVFVILWIVLIITLEI